MTLNLNLFVIYFVILTKNDYTMCFIIYHQLRIKIIINIKKFIKKWRNPKKKET